MVRRAPTNQIVTRVRNEGVPTRVPHRSLQDTLVLGRREVLQEDMFDAPETPRSECSDFWLDRSYSTSSSVAAPVLTRRRRGTHTRRH